MATPLRAGLAHRYEAGAALLGLSPEDLRRKDAHGGLTIAQDVQLVTGLGHGSDLAVRARRRLFGRALLWELVAQTYAAPPASEVTGWMSSQTVAARLEAMGWQIRPDRPSSYYRAAITRMLLQMHDDGDVQSQDVYRATGAVPLPDTRANLSHWHQHRLTSNGIRWVLRHGWDVLLHPTAVPAPLPEAHVLNAIFRGPYGERSYPLELTLDLDGPTAPVLVAGQSRIPYVDVQIVGASK